MVVACGKWNLKKIQAPFHRVLRWQFVHSTQGPFRQVTRWHFFLSVLLYSIIFTFLCIRVRTHSSFTYYSTTSTHESNPGWGTPDSIHHVFHMTRDSTRAKYYANYSFLRPLVYFAYAVPREEPAGHHRLYVYSSGITIGSFNRGFEVVGCLVGNEVHPVLFSKVDATVCDVSRRIQPGERVSLVLLKNEKLQQALQSPVDLGRGAIAKLEPEDVMKMPKGTIMRHDVHLHASKIMHIRSYEGAQIEGTTMEEMPSKARYEICAATQTKLYPHLLKDWVDYHRRIGVDMFFIVDNNSKKDQSLLFKGRQDVEVIYWPWERSQIQVFTYFLQMAKSRCEWILLFDADEWVMIGIGKNHEFAGDKPLKQYIHKHEAGVDGVEFRFLLMGSGGLLKIPKEPVPEAYTYLSDRDDSRHGKLIVKCDLEYASSGVHWASVHGKRSKFYRTPQQFNMFPESVEDDASLVHYRYRSFEDRLIRDNSKSGSFGDNRNVFVANPGVQQRVPFTWTTLNESMKYMHFRDIWRSVSKSSGLDEQSLVRTIGHRRCVRTCKIQGILRKCYEEDCSEVPKINRNQ